MKNSNICLMGIPKEESGQEVIVELIRAENLSQLKKKREMTPQIEKVHHIFHRIIQINIYLDTLK